MTILATPELCLAEPAHSKFGGSALAQERGCSSAPARVSTSVAQELRELAARIEELARASRVHSIAWPAVSGLAEFLSLRAAVSEAECSTATPRPDDTELEARLRDAVGHDGDVKIATRAVVENLDCAGRDRAIEIAITRARHDDRAMARARALVTELHGLVEGGLLWDAGRALAELEGVLVRGLP